MEKLNIIDKIAFFNGLTAAEREAVASIKARIFKYKEKSVIIKENAQDSFLYFLIKGVVTVVDRKTGPLAIFQPGEVFGEMAFLARGMPRTADVIANTEVILIRVDADGFNDLDPSLREKLKDKLILIAIKRLTATNQSKDELSIETSSFSWRRATELSPSE